MINLSVQALNILNSLKDQLKELNTMKNSASMLSRLQVEVIALQKNIARLEETLHDSGFTKTREEIQQELEVLADAK